MDQVLGYLIERMKQEEILDNINIIVLSDHGMAKMQDKSEIFVQNYVQDYQTLINLNKTVFGIVSNIYPINETMVNFNFVVSIFFCYHKRLL